MKLNGTQTLTSRFGIRTTDDDWLLDIAAGRLFLGENGFGRHDTEHLPLAPSIMVLEQYRIMESYFPT